MATKYPLYTFVSLVPFSAIGAMGVMKLIRKGKSRALKWIIVGPTLLEAYRGRIINLHPSLLPSFKGAHAIEQALEFGVKVFGATIHYVDETLDGGRIIAQRAVPYEGSDIDELTAAIHAVEHDLYIDTINKLLK